MRAQSGEGTGDLQDPDGIGTGPGGGEVVIPSPEAGILLVRASARRHREVRAYLDDVLASARRQVLIEATIVEVELSDRYQAGVRLEPARRRRRARGESEPARGPPGRAAVLPVELRGRVAGSDGGVARAVRQGSGAFEPEARGPEQSDRGAEGDSQHRLLRGERGDRERDGHRSRHRQHRHRRADRPGRHHARGDPAREPCRRGHPERAADHHPRQPLRQRFPSPISRPPE